MTSRTAILTAALVGCLALFSLVFYGLDTAMQAPLDRKVCVTLNFDSSIDANSYRAGMIIKKENIGKTFSKDEIAQALLDNSSVKFNIEDVDSYDINEGSCSHLL